MTIDFKRVFRNKNHRQGKINNLERLESRRWAKDEFCDTTPNCQDGKVSGVCTEKPQFCSMEYIPVKGCDGKTYSNRCHAQAEGQPITGLAEQPK